MDNDCMVEVAFDNKEEIHKVIDMLLNKKLVASCQMIESDSYWNWNSERENSKEYLLFIKTKKVLTQEIYQIIKEIHSYDCFEFAIVNFESCNDDYKKMDRKGNKIKSMKLMREQNTTIPT